MSLEAEKFTRHKETQYLSELQHLFFLVDLLANCVMLSSSQLMGAQFHFLFILCDISKFGSKSDSQGDGNVAYVTNLGAWRSTDVPFTVDGFSSASLPVSGDLKGLDDTFWTNHVILTG